MKRYLILTGLVITSIFARGQANDEQTIRQMLTELSSAFLKSDVAPLDRMYASDFVFISPMGVKFTKAQRLDNIKSTPSPEVFEYANPQIRFYDNTAVVNTDVKIKPKGKDLENHFATIVLVKKDGHWQIVNGQGTRKSANP